MGLSHCRHNGLVTIWDKARLRRGHNDQSRRGHQCSKTTLTGESQCHISIPLGIDPGSLMRSKGLTHWTSETVYECSEIAGSPQAQVRKRSVKRCTLSIRSMMKYVLERVGRILALSVTNVPSYKYCKLFTTRLFLPPPIDVSQKYPPGD